MSEGFSLKEMIQELRAEQRQQTSHTASILTSLENIDGHLSRLNSKVATHEEKIGSLGTFQTKVMTVWGLAISVVVIAINKFI